MTQNDRIMKVYTMKEYLHCVMDDDGEEFFFLKEFHNELLAMRFFVKSDALKEYS